MTTSGSNEVNEISAIDSPSIDGREVCCHQIKATMMTSWTEKNPGRRFLCCKYWKNDRNCNYFQWHDPDLPKYTKDLLRTLKNEKKFLTNEKEKLHAQLNILREQNELLLLKLSRWEEQAAALTLMNERMENELSEHRLANRNDKSDGKWMKILVLVLIMIIMLLSSVLGGGKNVNKLMLAQ